MHTPENWKEACIQKKQLADTEHEHGCYLNNFKTSCNLKDSVLEFLFQLWKLFICGNQMPYASFRAAQSKRDWWSQLTAPKSLVNLEYLIKCPQNEALF